MGEPAGRVITTVATVYASLLSLVLVFLILGWLTGALLRNFYAAFIRGFSTGKSVPQAGETTPPLEHSPPFYTRPPTKRRGGCVGGSDSSSMSNSNAPTGVLRRRVFLAQCLWLHGRAADALNPTPCGGRRAKPATALYDDWVIQNGARVRNARFPLSSELCAKNRLDYSDYKLKTKCPNLGCWSTGAPTPSGKIERPLHSEQRSHSVDDLPLRNPPGVASPPSAKSVKIEGYESGPHPSGDSSASKHEVPIRRPSSESASVEANRFSTGSESTLTMSDESPCSEPLRNNTATSPAPAPRSSTPSTRQKAYHFNDEPPVCDSDTNRMARALVSHEPPTRRHTVLPHQPTPAHPKVQNVNSMTTPISHPPPTSNPPVLRGSSLVCRATPSWVRPRPYLRGPWPNVPRHSLM